MSFLDWLVLVGTLSFIVFYGIWKTKGSKNIEGFILADRKMNWGTICLSIMATQASAITFLSTPGQAFENGMGFIQFYLGLPVAMIIISITAVPLYSKLNVYTAYEYLETRFDLRTRALAALLFLIQRGLSTGITIYAPAIVLSTILGWNLMVTNILIGGLVILYTVSGGTKAVSVTQEMQMIVILSGMFLAGFILVKHLPPEVGFMDAVHLAGHTDKMNLIKFSFNWNDRYNFWSGMIGGLFLAMSYFGTDQSQVGRYLQGKSIKESRLGLLFNGLLKIPMQFLILLIGVLVFVFYQFNPQPVFFNKIAVDKAHASAFQKEFILLESENEKIGKKNKADMEDLSAAIKGKDKIKIDDIKLVIKENLMRQKKIKEEYQQLLPKVDPDIEPKDTDYVFITFILSYLPKGVIGLLLAVMFCAAMSSTASGLNALGATTVVDIYKRMMVKNGTEKHYLIATRIFTIFWGIIALLFAIIASNFENLIQAVNILGSLFYGTILGIFLSAFYFKKIKSLSVFIAALLSEVTVILCYIYAEIGYLWYNVIGCFLVILLGLLIEFLGIKKAIPMNQV